MAWIQIKIGAAAVSGALCALLLALPAQAQTTVAAAQTACDSGQYAQALTLFVRASDQGDALASERAGEMLLLGPAFYGAQVPQDFERAVRHLVRAAREGRPVAIAWLERIGYPPVWRQAD